MFQKHLSTPLGTKIAEQPGNENEGKVMKLQTQELRNMVGEMHRAEQFLKAETGQAGEDQDLGAGWGRWRCWIIWSSPWLARLQSDGVNNHVEHCRV